LQGPNFDPTPFLADEQFEILEFHRVGEIAAKGRSVGQPLDFGYVRFSSREKNFEEFVNRLYSSRELITGSRDEIRELHIFLEYEGQCNWEFTPSLLRMVSDLELVLTITCDAVEPLKAALNSSEAQV
jgi:hypothetical protein